MKVSSIKVTVIAAIGALGLIGLVQAGAAWYTLNQVDLNFDFMTSNVLPTIEKVADLREQSLQARALLAEEAMADKSQKQTLDDAVASAVASTDKILADYKPLIVDQGDKDTYDAVTGAWDAWKQSAAPVQKAALAGDAAGVASAFAPQATAADALAKAIVAMETDKIGNANDAADATSFNIDTFQLTGMILACVLVLGVIGTLFMLLRGVVRPIGRITAAMKSIANNEFETEVPGLGRKDEIGAMAQAVEVFRENGMKVQAMSADERATAQLAASIAAEGELLGERLMASVTAASQGDFSVRIPTNYSQANLNGIAKIINDLVETVQRGLTETGDVLAAVARTDLTRRVEGNYQGSFAELKDNTNAVANKLADIVSQLKSTSGSLKLATGEILSGANDLSERTTKQAATIEETSAAMEQLAATVMQNAKRASDATEVAATVTRTAEEGGQVMNAANDAMERITASSAKISNIIGLIDDIAFQTNLLALNASVEAARAGDAGKGFAVVAVEVRRLAQSAASASSEVKALIDQSGAEVSTGSKLVADAAGKLASMLQAARSSNELMDGIAKDSREQASAIDEVTTAVRTMDEMTQHNAALVEEINASIEQTESQAIDLDRIVDIFTVGDRPATASAPAPREVAPAAAPARKAAPEAKNPNGIKAIQEKVKQAAKSYLGRSGGGGAATATAEDWSEF